MGPVVLLRTDSIMILSILAYKEPVANENTWIVSFDLFFFFLDEKNHDD